MAVKVKFGLSVFPRLSDKMQNKANTSFVSNFAMKITEKWACHDLSKINRNTEFISVRMRSISYVSLAILFFFLPVYSV